MQPPRILVIGGGITGLAAALRVKELLPSAKLELWEAATRLGGVLQTVREGGFLLELSADNFLTPDAAGLPLANKLGLWDELLPTNPAQRKASILYRGVPHPVPEGFVLMAPNQLGSLLTTPLLSWRGKLRLLAELFIEARPAGQNDESLESFALRRFGREAYERLIQPLIGGIYTADPTKLSLAATLPRFLEMERQHGSVLQASLLAWQNSRLQRPLTGRSKANSRGSARTMNATEEKADSGARYSQFMAPRQGMEQLIAAAANSLGQESIQLAKRVTRLVKNPPLAAKLAPTAANWQVWSNPAEPPELFDGVIMTTPAPAAASLVEYVAPELAAELRAIEYAGSSVVILGYEQTQFARPLVGFGMVVPRLERRGILAVSYASEKFPGRAPAGMALLRVFVGGALQPELNDLNDAALVKLATGELREIYGIQGEPRLVRIARWQHTMPQYHLGHLERVARIEGLAQRLPGFALAGAAYRGVGIPQCIRQGEIAAEKLAASFLVAN
ncbi:MAG: protoporphyrinogen oxidase [Pirellulales bacterium]|nr:protoporphyrinogen oxidase [Pirellulales bacterium]